MKLTVTQQQNSGVFASTRGVNLIHQSNNIAYTISVMDRDNRQVIVAPISDTTYPAMFGVYYNIETLLMLFEGQFFPTLNVFENNTDITHCWRQRTLPSYSSADFMVGTDNILVDYSVFLNSNALEKWSSLRDDLDMIHNMVLYCLSSVQMPVDMKCAFMTEAYLGIAELLKEKRNIVFPSIGKGESKLQKYLQRIILTYGQDIFGQEIQRGLDVFTQVLVDSRNRIAHIKSKQERVVLNGSECVMYLMKLSLLYRLILLDLLDISVDSYKDRLVNRVQLINEHDAVKSFLPKLVR